MNFSDQGNFCSTVALSKFDPVGMGEGELPKKMEKPLQCDTPLPGLG